MSNIITSTYNGVDVFFQENAFLNATAIAAHFNKKPIEWLRLPTTEEYINALCQKAKVEKSHFVRTTRGGSDLSLRGTWLHRRLAVAFARWLDVEFAIWCDDQIEKILIERNQPQQPALPEPTLNPAQQRQVQKMVDDVNKESGITHAELYSRLKNKFRIARYDQLPQTKLHAALVYLASLGLPFADAPKPLKLSLRDVLPLAAIIGTLRRNAAVTADSPILHHGRNALHKLVDALPEPDQTLITDLINP